MGQVVTALRSETAGEEQGHLITSRCVSLQMCELDLPDDFQGVCYLLLLNVIEFHLEASTGKQQSPAPTNESTGEKIKQKKEKTDLSHLLI